MSMTDQSEIAALVVRFADAVNRLDVPAFESVWAPEGTWIIDPPTDFTVSGTPQALGEAFGGGMRAVWKSFMQFPHGTVVVDVSGDHATARSYLTELGVPLEGETGYLNHGTYVDELERTPDGWRFRERHYQYVYLDFAPLAGNAAPLGGTL